jgi:hypothetical protein
MADIESGRRYRWVYDDGELIVSAVRPGDPEDAVMIDGVRRDVWWVLDENGDTLEAPAHELHELDDA